MKQIIARTLAAFVLVVVGLAATSPAQSMHTIKVNIPFEFSFGNKTFPAGTYSVSQPVRNLLMLSDARGRSVAQGFSLNFNSQKAVTAPTLRFMVSNGERILTQVLPEDSAAQELYPARQRAVVAKGYSNGTRETAVVSQP